MQYKTNIKQINMREKKLYNDTKPVLGEVTPRQKFVSEMKPIISKLDAIDKETPWQHTEPEWWLEMMEIRQKAFNAMQKFKA